MRILMPKTLENCKKDNNYKWAVLTCANSGVHFTWCFEGRVHQVLYLCSGGTRKITETFRLWTGFSIIVELGPYMPEAYLMKNRQTEEDGQRKTIANHLTIYSSNPQAFNILHITWYANLNTSRWYGLEIIRCRGFFFLKRRAPRSPLIRSNVFWKSWIWDSYLSKTSNGSFETCNSLTGNGNIESCFIVD